MFNAKDVTFQLMPAEAKLKGWVIPPDPDPFSEDSWMCYWRAMEYEELHPGSGRSIPPHRSA